MLHLVRDLGFIYIYIYIYIYIERERERERERFIDICLPVASLGQFTVIH